MSGDQPTTGRPDPDGPGQPGWGPPDPGFGRPSGPTYGPGGHPAPGGSPYGGQPGQPAGPYPPGPYGPGPYGPGPQGSGPYGPQGPYGPLGPEQPGGAGPGGRRKSRLLLIIGAAVLALVVLTVGAAALFNRSTSSAPNPSGPAFSTGPNGSTGPSASTGASQQPAPVTAKASDAVRAFLQALADGHAEAALALSSQQPADKTFLNDAVLAASNARAPITSINVPELSGDYVYSVPASYRLGSQDVSSTYSVVKEGVAWKVRQPYRDLNLSYLRSRALAMFVNKVEVKTDTIHLFPGSYDFTTGTKLIDYGPEHILVVKGPLDVTSMSDLKPTLTTAGTNAYLAAVEAKLAGCAQDGVMAPKGCPNGVREVAGQQVDEKTVDWTFDKDSMASFKPRLDYDNPTTAKAFGSVKWTVTARGSQNGAPAKFGQTVTIYPTVTANVSRQPIKVVLER